jgi:hypothetical protein
MGYSFKLRIDRTYERKDGCGNVYFQVIINRQKKHLGLDFSWPVKKFSLVDGCKPRFKDDEDADVYNVVIDNARKKAADIRKLYLLRGWQLTMESFLNDYKSDLNKNDFIAYLEKKSFQRWNKREIADQTYRNEDSVINKLRTYSSVIPFNSFTPKWAIGYDKHLKKEFKNEINTRWGNHKVIQTYLTMAREDDRIIFDDPYGKFINRQAESNRGPLELSELKTLIELYLEWKDKPLKILHKNGVHQKDDRHGLTYPEVCILRKFLFGCNTSLRISDLQNLSEDLFKDQRISITPHKTEQWGTRIDSLPMNDMAKMLLEDEIKEVGGIRTTNKNKPLLRIFERYVDQSCNKVLKRIAGKAKINKNLHMHVARYTFGSLGDQAGVNHTALMKLMGIKKRETLGKYVKTNNTISAQGVQKMNELIK